MQAGLLKRLKQYLPIFTGGEKEMAPAKAYDLWSENYDDQPGNLMLALDEEIFTNLLAQTSLKGKTVVDIGCGTGRHWDKVLLHGPKSLIGCDVSEGMLGKLKIKYPNAVTSPLKDNLLPHLENNSCDVIISTLAMAHMEHLEPAFCEWRRVLKPDGEIMITDYHPQTLASGGNRTFTHHGRKISIKNYVHGIDKILSLAGQMGLEPVAYEERKVDESVKVYYERKNALHVFEKFKGLPIIFGMHLKSKYAVM